MKLPCGCCAGIQVVTPESEANRPGLPAIAYRVGTHATFLESMIARLSSLYLDVPAPDGSGSTTRVYPLKQLTTRDPSDPSIALLDAWAVVADVLSFYEERIANEGYLPTATERRSILELARLIGYKLRPGVSASVYLAFIVANGFQGVIPAGTRSQSIPGTGETAQFFETSYDLPAHDTWNNIRPRLTRPQVITVNADVGTDASTRETLYFQGTSTNLKTGDALLIVNGDGSGEQVIRFIASVDVQAAQNRTEVLLQELSAEFPTEKKDAVQSVGGALQKALQTVIEEASSDFPGTDIASEVAAILQSLLASTPQAASAAAVAASVSAVLPKIQALYDVAVKRNFTRMKPWIANLLATLNGFANLPSLGGTAASRTRPTQVGATVATSPLDSLAAIVGDLAKPPSLQPANPTQLARTVAQTFSPDSDTAPRLLGAFKPAAALTLYQAWANVDKPPAPVQVFAMRVKASVYGHSAPRRIAGLTPQGVITGYAEWPIAVKVTQPPPPGKPIILATAVPSSSTYSISGSLGTNAAGATVTLSGKASATVIADANGNYSFSGLANGNYTVTATKSGFTFSPASQTLTIDGANQTGINFANSTVTYTETNNVIFVDGSYDKITSASWVVVQTPPLPEGGQAAIVTRRPLYAKVQNVNAGVSRSEYGMSGTATHIDLVQTDDPTTEADWIDRSQATTADGFDDVNKDYSQDFGVIRTTTVYAQGEELDLAEEPLDRDVEGDTIELDALYDGLESGRWVIISGERTDIPNVTGVTASELVMIAGVSQSVASPFDTVHTTLTLANNLAYKYDSKTVTIYGNVVNATHGQTVGEVLGDGDATQAFDTFALHQKPLTYVSAATPDGAQSTLAVRVNEIEWHEQPSLAALGRRDRGFVTQTDNSDQTSVIFGNGEHGARVPTGTANIKATYRYGIGSSGNVQANQISQLATHPLGVQGVINPLAATGGADRDTLDQGRRNAAVAVKALDRLVSTDDYAEFARTYAGIGKAAAARLSDGRRLLVHVTIAGADDIPIDQNSDLYQNLIQSLLDFGDPHQPLQVCVRKVQLLVIAAGVQILPDYAWESVEPKIRAAVLDAFSFDNRDLGQSAFLSEAIAVMQNIEGVSYVDVQTFDAVPEDITAGQLAGLASTLGRKNHVFAQLARLNPAFDPAVNPDPCQRVLPAELVFLTPSIPDTLILTQIGGS